MFMRLRCPDEVRVRMKFGVTTGIYDRRKELAVTVGAKTTDRWPTGRPTTV